MNEIVHAKFGLGAPLRRKEDAALITGRGHYTDDEQPGGALAGFVLRSPHAHARFTITDTSAAAAHPGVHLVLTAADLTHLKGLTTEIDIARIDGKEAIKHPLPLLCEDIVRHVGDAVAFIVADDALIAKDAAELIAVDWQPLAAVVDTEGALAGDAPRVFADAPDNIGYSKQYGDEAKVRAAFDGAAHVVELKIVNNRVVCNYMEPRACLAEWKAGENRWEVFVGSQGVHGIQNGLRGVFGVPREAIRVRTGDVGGGFGTKSFPYREYPLVMEAAKRLGRPVKWVCERNEHFLSDAHGRDNVSTARMAMDAEGRFLAVEIDIIAAMGAYLHWYGPYIPHLGVTMTTGLYDIPAMAVTVRGVMTNTVPTDAYRGAGRPEAAYLIERLVDECARRLDMPREAIRRRNFIRPEQLPYTTPGGRMYDTGEFEAHMDLAMSRAGWATFDERAQAAKAKGLIRGIGMATYIEACAFAGSEPAFLELKTDGTVALKIGTQSNGQGHATAYAQLAAEKLGLSIDEIDVRQGDTDELKKGGGTGGSRSVPLGGVSVVRGAEALAEKIRKLAADRLEASGTDIELVEGSARVVGTDRSVTLAEIASGASHADDLKGEGEFKQAEATYPNGTHICEVEIDPATGETEVVAYTIVDDFGVTVNPILLAGQVHGGVVQSIGQALRERVVYDETGQLLTATLMDYSLPLAEHVPNFHFETRNVPSTTNALGIKGAGEAGTIGGAPAVMNAVCDALYRATGQSHIDMPAYPPLLWEALRAARA